MVSLPDSFVKLSSLEKLLLRDNQLEFLPADFHVLPSLKTLDLRGNPLKFAPDMSEKLDDFQVPPDTLLQVDCEGLFRLYRSILT